jgi:hypothetical protein
MYSAWVLIAPRMRVRIAGSDLTSGWYCSSWLVESRSHSAFISPVTTNDCAPSHFPVSLALVRTFNSVCLIVPSSCHRTVVSRVFGKAFSKSRARSLSTILPVTSSITFSTRGEENVRHCSEGRWNGSCIGPFENGWL